MLEQQSGSNQEGSLGDRCKYSLLEEQGDRDPLYSLHEGCLLHVLEAAVKRGGLLMESSGSCVLSCCVAAKEAAAGLQIVSWMVMLLLAADSPTHQLSFRSYQAHSSADCKHAVKPQPGTSQAHKIPLPVPDYC